MAKEEEKEVVNFDAEAMLKENGEKKTVIRFSDRVEVKLIKDTVYQKAGKVYSPHKVKAEALVKQGIAEYVK